MAKIDELYHDLGKQILRQGKLYSDPNRKGVKRLEIPFGVIEYDMAHGFPMLTTKDTYWDGILYELMWFMKGITDVSWLSQRGVNFWNKDAYNFYKKNTKEPVSFEEFEKGLKNGTQDGECGPIYGKLWRDYRGFDQLQYAYDEIRHNPNSTRAIVVAWDPTLMKDQALPPCHLYFQFSVSGNTLNLTFVMRSSDYFLGLPFNIASYATLLCIFSELLGYVPGKLACVLNNAHIYTSHLSAVEEQLSRDTNMYGAPELKLTGLTDINEISADQIKLKNYKRCKKIKAKMEALS